MMRLASRSDCAEVFKDLQPRLPGFFRMKLHAKHVPFLYCRRESPAVLCAGDGLLNHQCKTISKDKLHLPGPDFIDRIHLGSDRPVRALVSLQQLFKSGRLAGTGYVSILPVDQGIEHSAGASFAPNPIYFDPENLVKLAIEGGCNAIASTLGVLGSVARKYAHKIPFLLKFNHNEFL